MTTRIRCCTRFDITVTGVRNHTNRTHLPFQDQAGQAVTTEREWLRSRNQQRNWDTVNQILALRTLPENATVPVAKHTDLGRQWQFEFDIPDLAAVSEGDQALGLLYQDCEAVPMITGLGETAILAPELRTRDSAANVWFVVVA